MRSCAQWSVCRPSGLVRGCFHPRAMESRLFRCVLLWSSFLAITLTAEATLHVNVLERADYGVKGSQISNRLPSVVSSSWLGV